MSKRALTKYLKSLNKAQLEEQVMDLYTRFDDVRVYYNFVFNPKEDALIQNAKLKISKEYFPVTSRRAKARRSIAHKQIKHLEKLGVDPIHIGDLMLYNLEIAQAFSENSTVISQSFTKSMFNSFEQAVNHINQHGILVEFKERIVKIYKNAQNQNWDNCYKFDTIMDQFD